MRDYKVVRFDPGRMDVRKDIGDEAGGYLAAAFFRTTPPVAETSAIVMMRGTEVLAYWKAEGGRWRPKSPLFYTRPPDAA